MSEFRPGELVILANGMEAMVQRSLPDGTYIVTTTRAFKFNGRLENTFQARVVPVLAIVGTSGSKREERL